MTPLFPRFSPKSPFPKAQQQATGPRLSRRPEHRAASRTALAEPGLLGGARPRRAPRRHRRPGGRSDPRRRAPAPPRPQDSPWCRGYRERSGCYGRGERPARNSRSGAAVPCGTGGSGRGLARRGARGPAAALGSPRAAARAPREPVQLILPPSTRLNGMGWAFGLAKNYCGGFRAPEYKSSYWRATKMMD